MNSQKLKSDSTYKADYQQNIHGKGPSDLANSYPEYEHLRKVGKLINVVSKIYHTVLLAFRKKLKLLIRDKCYYSWNIREMQRK